MHCSYSSLLLLPLSDRRRDQVCSNLHSDWPKSVRGNWSVDWHLMVVVTRSRAIADTEVVVADRQLDQMNTSTECSPSPDLAPEAAYDACDACRPPVDSLPKPAKVSLYSSWRRKRKYRGTFGYFGSDAPYYGCPVLLKVAALIGISVICVLGCVQAETARPRVLFALGVIWATRVLVGVFVLWQRHIG